MSPPIASSPLVASSVPRSPDGDVTSQSVLARLGAQPDDADAKNRLAAFYLPLLNRWSARLGLQKADEDDLVQNVVVEIHRLMPQFLHREPRGRFRDWVRGILANRVHEFYRRRSWFWQRQRPLSAELEAADSALALVWDREHDTAVTRSAWERYLKSVPPQVAEILELVVCGGRRATEVAPAYGVSVDVIYQRRHRALKQLRAELKDIVDLD